MEIAAVILLLVGGFFFLVGWIEGNPVLARMRMAVAIAIPAMLLAGCGGNAAKAPSATAPSATLIVQQMKDAMSDATSVHIDGSVTRNGLEIFLNVSLERSGRAKGVILTATPSAIKSEAGGLNILTIDSDDVYFEVTPTSLKTFKARASLCSTECGKFVKIPASQAKSLSANFTMTGVLGGFTGEYPSFTIQGTAIVKGVRVRVLRAVGTTIYAAAAGTPFPVVVDESGSYGNGELVFTEWNAVPAITAPPPGQVVSMSSLTG
ncbi:MAG: hypothetical protein ABSA93_36665 [Streptosporangiaceae bacterium]|jgi:hypothetical protein